MADRKLVHNVSNWEDLLHMSDPRATESSNVTAESPLHLYLNRRELTKIIESSMRCIEANAPTLDTTPAAKADTAFLLDQRAKFLVWLQAQQGDTVYVSLHPHTIYELVEPAAAEDADESPAPPEPWQD
jgi:hypothetical protein